MHTYIYQKVIRHLKLCITQILYFVHFFTLNKLQEILFSLFHQKQQIHRIENKMGKRMRDVLHKYRT